MTTTVTEREGRHTPTPWKLGVDMEAWTVHIDDGGSSAARAIGTSDDHNPIAIVVTAEHYTDPEFVANAEFIVRACNARDDLVAALRDMLHLAVQRDDLTEMDWGEIDNARAALAKAGAS